MRCRLGVTVLLSTAVLALLALPTASLANQWAGSWVKLSGGSAYTNVNSVPIEFYGVYTSDDTRNQPAGIPNAMTTGDTPRPEAVANTSSGVDGPPQSRKYWASGSCEVELTKGDGAKSVGVYFVELVPFETSPTYLATVTLDTQAPTTIAPKALSCKKGGYATVSFQANDALSPTVDVSLLVTNSKGKKVATASMGEQETGKLVSYLWKCSLAPGKYKYAIVATDLAGNKTSKPGTNKLTVK